MEQATIKDALNGVLGQFARDAPLCVMTRALFERVFRDTWIDEVFEDLRERSYQREILFSSLVGLMSQVVTNARRSVRAAYEASNEEIAASLSAVYEKLARGTPELSAGLVDASVSQLSDLITEMGAARAPLLVGRQVRILDGNCIASTHHRIKELRDAASAPLPGKCLVTYDPALDLMIDVIPCEDGHAEERSLLHAVVARVGAGETWIADRNFCTFGFLYAIADKDGEFIIRHHANVQLYGDGDQRLTDDGAGLETTPIDGGRVAECSARLIAEDGRDLTVRCVYVLLDTPTRDDASVLRILTNVPTDLASAQQIPDLYRGRWQVETAFQKLQRDLHSEINSLGYPRAALFGFCIAVIAYNAYSTVQAALRAAHGAEKVDGQISHYYLADFIQGPHRGMMIAVPDPQWQIFRGMPLSAFTAFIVSLARAADMRHLRKAPTRRRTSPCKKRTHAHGPPVVTIGALGSLPRRSTRWPARGPVATRPSTEAPLIRAITGDSSSNGSLQPSSPPPSNSMLPRAVVATESCKAACHGATGQQLAQFAFDKAR